MNPVAAALESTPVIAVVCGSGQVASAAMSSDADLLFVLNAGFYRSVVGVGSLAAGMPYGNANDQTEDLLERYVLPHGPTQPVIAGVLASDPTQLLDRRLARLKEMGVHGVANWPAVGLFDGRYRAVLEAEELGVAGEAAMLAVARAMGFFTFGVAFNEDDALRFAESGVDALVIGLGLTRTFTDIYERRDQIQHTCARLNGILARVRQRRPAIKCLTFGGPMTAPEDIEQFFQHSSADGFAGGSAFDRLPVDSIIASTIRRFKSIAASHGQRSAGSGLGPMLGKSPAMAELFKLIARVAPYDVNVCIEGESGTGKELVATQIHRMSKRAQQAFVTLNCGAIPESLLESELFGHEKGAFTGADRRRLGKFELAHRGTLFLDEIADLSPRGQVALLRAIQQREITRVGGESYIPVDVRILAASNRPLAPLVDAGAFRADLYHRLNPVTLKAPPLRERAEDVPLLAGEILSRLEVQVERRLIGLSPGFLAKLRRHAWKGNVRELQHVITRAALLEDGPVLEGAHFTPEAAEKQTVDDLKRAACAEAAREAIAKCKGNKSLAAAELGVSRKTLYAWLREQRM